MTKTLLNAIFNSVDDIPEEVKTICIMLGNLSEQKFKGTKQSVICYLFYGRLISPAISFPRTYKITQSTF